jgi:hypothetical protein
MQKLFQKVYPSSHPKSAHYQCVPSVGGQDDNSRFRFFTLDCYHRLQAAHLRHLDVHQNHIRTICSKLLKRGASDMSGCASRIAAILSRTRG